MSRLDEFLEQFEANATRLGRKFTGPAMPPSTTPSLPASCQRHGVTRVVKSKSMLTEECGLNPHLEQFGIEVTDTDLGEWIVQLRHEHPSHIVTPAIHIMKEQSASCFTSGSARQRGATDPPYLADAAREHLRDTFLARPGRYHGRQLRDCRDWRLRRLHERRQRRPRRLAAEAAHRLHGHRKTDSAARPIWGFPASVRPLGHGPAHHYILIALSRAEPGRRAAHRAGGQRTQRAPRQHRFRRSLNCIRCGACFNTCPVYRRSGGHSYGVTVRRTHRLDHQCRPRTARTQELAVCVQLVRLMQRCVPGQDRPPSAAIYLATATRPVRACAKRKTIQHQACGRGTQSAVAVSNRRPTRASCASNTAALAVYSRFNIWGRQRDLPPPPKQSFRELYRQRTTNGQKH